MSTEEISIIIERDDFSTYCDLLWAYQGELLSPEITSATVKTESSKEIFKILQEDIVLMAEYKMPAGVVIVNRYKTILEAQANQDLSFSILHDDNINNTLGSVVFEIELSDVTGDEEVILQNKVKLASYAELIKKIEHTALQMEAITKGTYKDVNGELAEHDATIENSVEEEMHSDINDETEVVRERKKSIIRRILSKLFDLFASIARLLRRAVRRVK